MRPLPIGLSATSGGQMLRAVLALLALLLAGTAGPAAAWDARGHRYAAAIADELLNDRAKAQVDSILGFPLAVAAPWPDCVRAIRPPDFQYRSSPWFPECYPFESSAEKRVME